MGRRAPRRLGKAASSTSENGTLESWEMEEKEDLRGARAQREWRSRDWGGASRSGGGYFVCELGGGGGPCQALEEASCVAQTLFYFFDKSGPGQQSLSPQRAQSPPTFTVLRLN